ncbi:MAG: eukaryotic-like serine/threonine-protein kinase [Acidobacteriota bacterium]|nr:eukaryotic-like serine/threonine-protein kinase [Acidobacteriota bacterium]
MTGLDKFIGEALDGKYRLERLLGQGGMGAVYLATHLGTERPVALKLIAPQFMRHSEFVERFKREARAAGRLRHPNVVDVTDFGFAETHGERVAYLVMEYLDGCTLGDVLAEEKRLPLDWTVDILEQVCSAVDEAHQQGIVHRDLKPDNIWLEPNRLGGYRVKVLDFGIAKLGAGGAQVSTNQASTNDEPRGGRDDAAAPTFTPQSSSQQQSSQSPLDAVQASIARAASSLHAPLRSSDAAPRDEEDEQGTRLFTSSPDDEEQGTRIFASQASDASAQNMADASSAHATRHAEEPRSTRFVEESDGTRLFDAQLRPTARADARGPGGDDPALSDAHTAAAAGAALTRVGSIMGTPLYMSPEQCRGERLDARADIYSLGVIAYQMLAGETPFVGDMVAVMRQHMDAPPTSLRERNKKVPERVARVVMSALAKDSAERPASAASFANSLRANVGGIGGLLRRAFALYSEHFNVFLRLSLIAHLPFIFVSALMFLIDLFDLQHRLSLLAYLAVLAPVSLLQFAANFLGTSVISGVTTIIVTQLQLAPLRPVRLREALAVLRRRWRPFLSTSIRITLRIMLGFILFVIPGFVMMVKYAFYAPIVLLEGLEKKAALKRSNELSRRSRWMVVALLLINFLLPLLVAWLVGGLALKAGHTGAHITTKASPRLVQLLNIVIVPLISITSALLYLKLRQMGGETMRETLEQFDETDAPRARWQQRMRERLSGYTPQARSRVGQSSGPSKLA